MKARSRWASLVSAVLVLLLLAFTVWRIALGIRVGTRLDAIKARGEPVNTAALNDSYVKPPDAENAALLWLEGFAQLVPKSGQNYGSGWSRFTLPVRGSALTGEVLIAAAGFVNSNRTALATFERAAKRPASHFPFDVSDSLAAETPHFEQLRNGADLLRLQAFVAAEAGNKDEAVSAINTILGAARSLKAEPTLLALLVRSALDRTAFQATQHLLNCAELTEDQLQSLSETFGQSEDPEGLRRALIGERAMILTRLSNPRQMFSGMASATDEENSEFANRSMSGLGEVLGIFDRDLRFVIDAFEVILPMARSPDPQRFLWMPEWTRIDNRAKAGYYVFASLLLPALSRSAARDCEHRARARIVQTVLALELFRLKHGGRLPASLSALVPEFLPELLLDPFDGQPLRFRPRPNGYIVYSIGPDGTDNDGAEKISGKGARSQPEDVTFIVER